jgi:hypothetical protein
MVIPDFPFDGNWVDCGSFASGLVHMVWRGWKARGRRNFISRRTAFDFANGIALFPQTLMLLCVLSTTIVNGLVAASKLSLCVAGSFALIALLEETSQPEQRRRGRTAQQACTSIGD